MSTKYGFFSARKIIPSFNFDPWSSHVDFNYNQRSNTTMISFVFKQKTRTKRILVLLRNRSFFFTSTISITNTTATFKVFISVWTNLYELNLHKMLIGICSISNSQRPEHRKYNFNWPIVNNRIDFQLMLFWNRTSVFVQKK